MVRIHAYDRIEAAGIERPAVGFSVHALNGTIDAAVARSDGAVRRVDPDVSCPYLGTELVGEKDEGNGFPHQDQARRASASIDICYIRDSIIHNGLDHQLFEDPLCFVGN